MQIPLFLMSGKKIHITTHVAGYHQVTYVYEISSWKSLRMESLPLPGMNTSLILNESKMYSSNATDATVNCGEYFQRLIIPN